MHMTKKLRPIPLILERELAKAYRYQQVTFSHNG